MHNTCKKAEGGQLVQLHKTAKNNKLENSLLNVKPTTIAQRVWKTANNSQISNTIVIKLKICYTNIQTGTQPHNHIGITPLTL